MHLKRQKTPKTWPLPRKGTKYLAVPLHDLKKGMPLIVALRDVLKVVKTRKEAGKILNSGKIKINYKIVKNEKYPLTLFDILSLDNKNFRLVLERKRFGVAEIKERDAGEKIVKVIGKKSLKGNKTQVNLSDGRNYLIKDKISVGDSVVIALKENKISEILPFKEGSKIRFLSGKHIGKSGIVDKIDKVKKLVAVEVDKEKINTRKEGLMVVK